VMLAIEPQPEVKVASEGKAPREGERAG
jgi:hypothetical protein